MNLMTEKLAGLWPEIVLLIGACLCIAVGLASSAATRRLAAPIAALALLIAGIVALPTSPSALAGFIKVSLVGVGLLLVLVSAAVPARIHGDREADEGLAAFEPGLIMRGEFFAFFLLSIAGAMLVAGASDLVWLFLALELTSLPTYVMVATARDRKAANESAVKYFFLGALAAAIFLYGFTLIYGATGSTSFATIQKVALAQIHGPDGLSPLFLLGMILAILGIAFKIAAVPMHFYAADVYQGAATPVTAFLAFVPKTAGFVALMLVLGLTGDQTPPLVIWLLWIMAALTMTVGNVLGLLQTNVKRVLAYSSVAHSGYMLLGLVAMGGLRDGQNLVDGQAAILFYLVAYGLATLAAFAVLGCLESQGDEAQEYSHLSGLAQRNPTLAATLLLSVLSLLGLPPLVGFLGKVYLFTSAIDHGHIVLVVIAALNSAVSAVYYLRIASACYFGQPDQTTHVIDWPSRRIGGAAAAAMALVLGFVGGRLIESAAIATGFPLVTYQTADDPAAPAPRDPVAPALRDPAKPVEAPSDPAPAVVPAGTRQPQPATPATDPAPPAEKPVLEKPAADPAPMAE